MYLFPLAVFISHKKGFSRGEQAFANNVGAKKKDRARSEQYFTVPVQVQVQSNLSKIATFFFFRKRTPKIVVRVVEASLSPFIIVINMIARLSGTIMEHLSIMVTAQM
jgi:hypothetical protein